MDAVEANQWSLTDEFAYAVCRLPMEYRSKRDVKYFQFLEDWGTVSVLVERNLKY